MSTLSDQIAAAANMPQSMSGDGISVSNRSLPDQIAADKYAQANKAATNMPAAIRGMFFKIVPPGGSR